PQREVPGEVLDQDAGEALHRAADRAVHHDRRLFATVGIDIERTEPLRQVKSTCVVPHCPSRPIASRSTYSNFGPYKVPSPGLTPTLMRLPERSAILSSTLRSTPSAWSHIASVLTRFSGRVASLIRMSFSKPKSA